MEKSFETGTFLTTAPIRYKMKDDDKFRAWVFMCVGRFKKGDWGNTEANDRRENDEAVKTGEGRIFAVYKKSLVEDSIWIVTEPDRQSTIIMFPDEY